MASVSSLDQDMRNLRLSKYTTGASNEVRTWIEETLGERLPGGDLLDALKDGVALCKLANLARPPPAIKFKTTQMPFIQMENISHFLRACEAPPLNMPAHDRFLTVDLYESKDPAQVLQCLSAFSRVANATNPAKFPTTIGPKRAGAMSPIGNGAASRNGATSPYVTSQRSSAALPSARPMSPARTGESTTSSNADSKSNQGSVSSWSKRGDEGTTSPAWNIHQYGYMGGASQGNQGISFGGRRQITSAAPHVPNAAEKDRKRKEKEAEEERLRVQAEEAERIRKIERDAEEERERAEEERKWEDETKRQRDEERRRIEEQKRQWDEQERRWKLEEEVRQREEAAMQQPTVKSSDRPRGLSDARLRGQYLSQYQAEQSSASPSSNVDTPEKKRVQELERQLEEARERERQYQLEREERMRHDSGPIPHSATPSRQTEQRQPSPKESEASWQPDEREYLRQQWQGNQPSPSKGVGVGSARPLPIARASATKTPGLPSRPLPEQEAPPSMPSRQAQEEESSQNDRRPLPNPTEYQSQSSAPNRTDRFLAQNAPPPVQRPTTYQPAEMGYTSTYEQQTDTDRRIASQQTTKAGGWASKSLLEREMERERDRQKEWEANQQALKTAPRDAQQGTGAGQSWDVNQYGYTGGDSQNKGSSTGSGIGFGGRRQIIGPRPAPQK